jgi:heme-degrading monooxygenase HmoA
VEAVITRVELNAGAESDWEAVMRDRMGAAESADGWIGGSILTPEDDPQARLIVGLWESRDAWETWLAIPRSTRPRNGSPGWSATAGGRPGTRSCMAAAGCTPEGGRGGEKKAGLRVAARPASVVASMP